MGAAVPSYDMLGIGYDAVSWVGSSTMGRSGADRPAELSRGSMPTPRGEPSTWPGMIFPATADVSSSSG
jgi:hypothetical protein